MPYEEFSYKNLNEKLYGDSKQKQIMGEAEEYFAVAGSGGVLQKGFIFLRKIAPVSTNESADGKIFKKHQLKFHISLPENELRAEGWDIIKDILINKGVHFFKIVDAEHRMSESKVDGTYQYGKDITIYTHTNPEKTLDDWQEILQTITQKLVDADIPPGYETDRSGDRADSPIQGSNYISCRYEQGIPSPNPCTNLTINVPGQLEPQTRNNIEILDKETLNASSPEERNIIQDNESDLSNSADKNCCNKCNII